MQVALCTPPMVPRPPLTSPPARSGRPADVLLAVEAVDGVTRTVAAKRASVRQVDAGRRPVAPVLSLVVPPPRPPPPSLEARRKAGRLRSTAGSLFSAHEMQERGSIAVTEARARRKLKTDRRILIEICRKLKLTRKAHRVAAAGVRCEDLQHRPEYAYLRSELEIAESLSKRETAYDARLRMLKEADGPPTPPWRPWQPADAEEEEDLASLGHGDTMTGGLFLDDEDDDGSVFGASLREPEQVLPSFEERFYPMVPQPGELVIPKYAELSTVSGSSTPSDPGPGPDADSELTPTAFRVNTDGTEECFQWPLTPTGAAGSGAGLMTAEVRAWVRRLDDLKARRESARARRLRAAASKGARYRKRVAERQRARDNRNVQVWSRRQLKMVRALESAGGGAFGTAKIPRSRRAPLKLSRHEAAGASSAQKFFDAATKGDIEPFQRAYRMEGGLSQLVHMRDKFGRTPLHFAAHSGHNNVLAFCLYPTGDPEAASEGVAPWGKAWLTGSRQSVLHYAAIGGQLATCELLVAAARRAGLLDRELVMRNLRGCAPYVAAQSAGWSHCAYFLSKLACNVDIPVDEIQQEEERKIPQMEHPRAQEQGREVIEDYSGSDPLQESTKRRESRRELTEEEVFLLQQMRAIKQDEALIEERRQRRVSRRLRREKCVQIRRDVASAVAQRLAGKERALMEEEDLYSRQREEQDREANIASDAERRVRGLRAARLGLELTDSQSVGGVGRLDYGKVVVVRAAGAAADAGISPGDTIVSVDGRAVASVDAFRQIVAELYPPADGAADFTWRQSIEVEVKRSSGAQDTVVLRPERVEKSPQRRYLQGVTTTVYPGSKAFAATVRSPVLRALSPTSAPMSPLAPRRPETPAWHPVPWAAGETVSARAGAGVGAGLPEALRFTVTAVRGYAGQVQQQVAEMSCIEFAGAGGRPLRVTAAASGSGMYSTPESAVNVSGNAVWADPSQQLLLRLADAAEPLEYRVRTGGGDAACDPVGWRLEGAESATAPQWRLIHVVTADEAVAAMPLKRWQWSQLFKCGQQVSPEPQPLRS
eukprot:TRINITY_DN24535_c0_g1_i1.p1 TRINITY_DN24535_c0_g1~~TRINITY_DN24535_c0_g1_i1.p1  ORF type:complete len:1053 (+),score=317.50 TRINITY_DN24535_c0_g1_i1:88-3246(+)